MAKTPPLIDPRRPNDRTIERQRGGNARRAAVIALAAVGVWSWLWLGAGRGIGTARWLIILAAALAGGLPPVARAIDRTLARFATPSRRSLNWTTIIIGLLSSIYFVSTAFNQGRDLFPKTHDDCSYAIGMQILARGRLWMPPLPLPDFFDSFYILVRPVYCSLYFPGTALLYVPTVWLHLPTWLMPALASGAAVGLLYRVTAELLDGSCGILAAISLVSLSWFRVYSILLTGHVAMLMWGLALVFAWLQWRKHRGLGWALAMGVAAGWAAITRPADAAIFALSVGTAIAWTWFKRHDPPPIPIVPANKPAFKPSFSGGPYWIAMCLLIIAGAAPFLALQMVFDRGVTGHPFRAPYGYYLERDQPGSGFGFHPYDPAALPESTLPEKREFYVNWARPYLAAHTPGNLAASLKRSAGMIADTTMQCRLLLVFAAIGLLGTWRSSQPFSGVPGSEIAMSHRVIGRRVVVATLPLFIVVYAFNPFFLEHYAILAIPAVVLLVIVGGQTLAAAWPRWQGQLRGAFAALIVAASVTSFWEVNRLICTPETVLSDETFPSPYLKVVNELSRYVEPPAVVLCKYHSISDDPPGNYFAEPVYNTDVAWPDEAPIIRAHDLGPRRNREIFEYYAKIQPGRTFWSLDPWRKDDPLKKLGTAKELAGGAENR